MTAYYAGIDPGLSGAVALYRAAHRDAFGVDVAVDVKIIDMPTFRLTKNGKARRYIDLVSLARWFDNLSLSIKAATIEDVHAMPGQGVSSCFSFGFSAGVAQMACASYFIPTRLVSPRVWKQSMKLSSDKDASRALASRMFPQFAHLWARAMDDGRAEALLLAVYGYRCGLAESGAAA